MDAIRKKNSVQFQNDDHTDGKAPNQLSVSVNSSLMMGSVDTSLNFDYTSSVLLSGDDITLMYSKHEMIPLKDFSAEIRASKDIQNFLKQAVLILDLHKTGLEEIIESMLHELLGKDEPMCSFNEARNAIFTHDTVHMMSRTIQSTSVSEGGHDYDQSWICTIANLPSLERRHVAIARLKYAANLGSTSQEVKFVIIILAPVKEKGTKDGVETGRTFATIFADLDLRQGLIDARTTDEFKECLWNFTLLLAEHQANPEWKRKESCVSIHNKHGQEEQNQFRFGRGIWEDLKRRLPLYPSDFKDGIFGRRTVQKTFSATVFLYFACIMPSIAFGVLNDANTKGKLDVRKVIISQTIGGLLFSLFGGQPLIILLTTAPLALYTKVIFLICEDFDLDFSAMFAWVGLWNMFFLLLYSMFNLSFMMKWSTRSTEEIFALFIAIAFSVDAIKDVSRYFDTTYHSCDTISSSLNSSILSNGSVIDAVTVDMCSRESSLLYLLLMLGTLWIGVQLYNFTNTPFLSENKREMLADYALPVAVIFMSFIGSYVFKNVQMDSFKYNANSGMELAPFEKLPVSAVFAAAGLGFCLSLLFYMDQNITSAMVNTPSNRLKKGASFHWDLMVVALLNGFLSIFGLPWVHGALPHSPLHVKALADIEPRVDNGHVYSIVVRVRETRLSGLISHILIGLSLLMLPNPLVYIPHAVLDGLFLYVAITSLSGNQLFDRIMLLVTEQSAYPPNHYIRHVPQKQVHMFTGIQLIQLAVLCVFGFTPWPYIKMIFPVILMFLMPFRHKALPRILKKKYIEALDSDIL